MDNIEICLNMKLKELSIAIYSHNNGKLEYNTFNTLEVE